MIAWDHSPDSTVVGYMLHYGTVSGDYSFQVDAGSNTMATAATLQEGQTYFFTVTSYNAQQVESLPSSEISYLVPGILQISEGTSQNPIRIRFPVAPPQLQRLQASEDLANWKTIWQGTGVSNAWLELADPQARTNALRFYRTVIP